MNNIQHIRRSQYILTYGPGSIIEGESGPRLIPTLDQGLKGSYCSDEKLSSFEIEDARMSNVLGESEYGESSRIFAVPSNSQLKVSDNRWIHTTYAFPLWRICYGKKHDDPVLYRAKRCPKCKNEDTTNVRFVAACTEGHLDDVNWNVAVHGNKGCRTNYFYWKARGSSLSDIVITCPICGAWTTMGKIYATDFNCSAWSPEAEEADSYYNDPDKSYKCSEKMKVIQRQSTSIRIPETFTLLTIPAYDNSLFRILKRSNVAGSARVAVKRAMDTEDFIDYLRDGDVPEDTLQEINKQMSSYDYDEFIKIAKGLFRKDVSFDTFLNEEFDSLNGNTKPTKNFKKRRSEKFDFPNRQDLDIDVFPIDRLRTVTVQTGYRRLPYVKKIGKSKFCASGISVEGSYWYPGFEGIGEGIFITSKSNPLEKIDNSVIKKWEDRRNYNDGDVWQGDSVSWREGMVKEPQFVWWHTLSHALIRTLSLTSGYSSASIRERVYLDRTLKTGGILLYTSSAGDDGGMGGLVESVNRFDEILDKAFESLLFCSNDPLCCEMEIDEKRVNGAACHSCLMVSETSCEHGNRWLDRSIITKYGV